MKRLYTLVSLSFLILFCTAQLDSQLDQMPHEMYKLDWPAGEVWQLNTRDETEKVLRIEMVRTSSSPEYQADRIVMTSHKGMQKMDVENIMRALYQEALRTCYTARLTVIDKDLSTEFPWVIFGIECKVRDNGEPGECQIWQVVQGKFALYTNARSFHATPVSEETKQKTASFFKTGRIVYNN